MNFDEFIKWAGLRETIPNTQLSYVKECFDYAKRQGELIAYYLPPFMLQTYIYCLALHLIILTPNEENMALHLKYFPDDESGANANLLGITSSVSNSTSSVSLTPFASYQNLDLRDAMLSSTPYGLEVASLNQSLQVGIIVV